MLFHSYTFLFLFLPLVFGTFLYLEEKKRQRELALAWLVIASWFFYAWWQPVYLFLLLLSTLFNFGVGWGLQSAPGRGLLVFGVGGNLALLGYFKYANFFLHSTNTLFDTAFSPVPIILPLAISFFTFQQIAWLVDVYRGQVTEYNLLHYCLFVCFFPQLIAGPIVHHSEMMPQFSRGRERSRRQRDVEVGITIFCLGFLKKVVLADTAAVYADPVFAAAAHGESISFFEAWGGTLAYSFQLYFDFSGYSDMAIGLARLFGIRLPVNFFSPYRSASIIDFWRRWHMTLSRFLRDYLYIPLGGNRSGLTRTGLNLLATMGLGGLWHGADWTFVCWGLLHGGYLILNRSWRFVRAALPWPAGAGRLGFALSVGLTFLAVTLGWVLFRADSFAAAARLYRGLAGGNGIILPPDAVGWLGPLHPWLLQLGWRFESVRYLYGWEQLAWLVVLGVIAFLLPNTMQLLARYKPALLSQSFSAALQSSRIQWRPTLYWATMLAVLMSWALLAINRVDEFLYFQF